MSGDRQLALMAWLALEREAVWLYPFLGARVPAVADRARRSLKAHQRTRDLLVAQSTVDTTRAEPAYDVGPLTSAKQARKAAQGLERRIQAACALVLRLSEPGQRELPLEHLRTAALAEITWSGKPQAFPGLD